MEFVGFTLTQFMIFLLILVRVSGFVAVAPFYGSDTIPAQVRVAFGLILSLILYPMVASRPVAIPDSLATYFMAAFVELGVGILVGFFTLFVFLGFQLAGGLVGLQMGIALANVIDPVTQEQTTILGQLQFLFAVVVFLAIDGHHQLLRGFLSSFSIVPLLNATFGPELLRFITIESFARVFVVAVQVSAPPVVALFLSTVAMGFMARAVPEMNIFILGFALQLVLGMTILVLSVPYMTDILVSLLGTLERDIQNLLAMMR